METHLKNCNFKLRKRMHFFAPYIPAINGRVFRRSRIKLKNCLGGYALFTALLLFSLHPLSAQDFIQTTLWSLSSSWWPSLTTGTDDEVESRTQQVLNSLHDVSLRVPEDNQESVQLMTERIKLNITQYLTLRKSQGWKIEAAPSQEELYTVTDFTNIAKEVKVSDEKAHSVQDEIYLLLETYDRIQKQVDELYSIYEKTTESSLQRTNEGLKFILAITTQAVAGERLRLKQEQLAGIKQKLSWYRELLVKAAKNLEPDPLNLEEEQSLLEKLNKKKKSIDGELLQIETELMTHQLTNPTERSLAAISRRVELSSTIAKIIFLKSNQYISSLKEQKLKQEEIHLFLEESTNWKRDLDKIHLQAQEWRDLVRSGQDALESTFFEKEELITNSNISEYKELFNYQNIAQEILLKIRDLEIEVFQTTQLASIVSRSAIGELNWISGFWKRAFLGVESFIKKSIRVLSYPIFRVHDKPINLIKVLYSILAIVLSYLLSSFVKRFLNELANRKAHISAASIYTFKQMAHYSILLVGFIWALSILGLDFSSLLIIAGALSVGIGFGLQGIVNNFLGGLIVLFDRKLRIGDFIELSCGETGHITEVNIQNTVIRTLKGHDILVPNSDIITRQLKNWTLRDQYTRFHMQFGVAYGSDKEKVKAVVEAAALRVKDTVSNHNTLPDPSVWLVGFGDSALNFELVVWVDLKRARRKPSSLSATYYWEIETALTENAIEIPFPQRDLHLRSGEWSHASS